MKIFYTLGLEDYHSLPICEVDVQKSWLTITSMNDEREVVMQNLKGDQIKITITKEVKWEALHIWPRNASL